MGAHDHNGLPGRRGQHPAQVHPFLGVEARGGLVQNQQLRAAQQRRRGQQPLLHAAGVSGQALVQLAGKVHKPRHPRGLGRGVFAGDLLEGRQVQKELPAGEAVVQVLLLGHIAQHPAEAPAQAQHIFPVPQHLPLCGGQVARDDVHHGAFSRAVGPQKAVQARAECEAHIGQGLFAGLFACVDFRQVPQLQLPDIGHGKTSLRRFCQASPP